MFTSSDTATTTSDDTSTASSDVPKRDILEKNLEKNKVQIFEESQKTSVGFEQIKKDELKAKTKTMPRVLPPDVVKHFEENSNAFVNFAKQKENETLAKIGDSVIDVKLWDRALLLEEYPNGRMPVEIEAKKDESVVSIPKKPWKPAGDILPTRVVTDMPKIPQSAQKEFVAIEIPKKNEPEQIRLPRYIPKKPVSTMSLPGDNDTAKSATATKETEIQKMPVFDKPIEIKKIEPTDKTNGMIAEIPKKPVSAIIPSLPSQNTGTTPIAKIIAENSEITAQKPQLTEKELKDLPFLSNQPEMGDALKTKIIEGQLRGVFENAPDGVKQQMEKLPAKEILSPESSSYDQNDVWKTRLREYIIRLKWQGKTVFGNAESTDPKEGETVLGYIKRIYPAIVRAEVNNETP